MPRRVRLQFHLSWWFFVAILAACGLLGFKTTMSVRSFIREGIQDRLVDAVQIGVLLIDVEAHRSITRPEDAASAAYQTQVARLRQIRDRSQGIRFVYTVRRDSAGEYRFVVDAEEDASQWSAVDEIYKSPSPALVRAFEPPYQTRVEDHFYTDKWGTFLSSYAPVLDAQGRLEAVLGMDMTAQKVLSYENEHLVVIVIATAMFCVVGWGLGWLFSRMISRPLLLLTRDVSQVQHLDLDTRVDFTSSITEVNQMKEAVDNMKSGLRSFRKYVPAELVTELIQLGEEATLGAEKRELTIFFSDIADFTTISERFTPEDLADRLAGYLEGVTRVILDNEGTVDKFIGDAVMAFWGAPRPTDEHALRACRASIEVQAFLQSMRSKADLPPELAFFTRIGIHTGEAVVGNMGYEERLSYTAIGDSVNIASRLEGLNKFYETSILISETTHRVVKDQVVTRLVDVVVVKGRSTGLAIHEVLGEKDRIDAEMKGFLRVYQEAVDHYQARSWNEAVDLLAQASQLRPGDRPTRILLDRCRGYLDTPPGPDWSGAVVMREK